MRVCDLRSIVRDCATRAVIGGALFATCPADAQCGTWEKKASGPGATAGTAAMYDSWRHATVVPDLVNGEPFDTWHYDGSDWMLVSTLGPGDRWNRPIAFDAARGVGIIHGGNNGFPSEDTLEFDGVAWREVNYGGVSPREGHALAYHPMQDRTYLFGGALYEDFKTTFYDTIYEWNGYLKDWKPVLSTPNPPKRAWHSMAYDSWRGTSVMYGGYGSKFPNGTIEYYADTWEWSGDAWLQRLDVSQPGLRWGAAMVFDSRRGVTVLWGGASGSFQSDLWEWDGNEWREVVTCP